MYSSETLYQFLDTNQISYQKFDHPAVFTCEEAAKIIPHIPGAETKNLFISDGKKSRYFLLTVPSNKRVDMKALGRLLEAKELRFASAEELCQKLGIEPGSVTILAAINDSTNLVKVVLDEELSRVEFIQSHPLINTATLVVKTEDLLKFLEITNHTASVIDVPCKR